MSGIVGLAAVEAKLARFDKAVRARLDDAVERAAREFQADLVAMAPVKDGKLKAALAGADAIKIVKGDGGVEVKVGFLSSGQKKAAFYAFFIEFGTKGYTPGQRRFSGKTKRGQARFTRIRRRIPARPAHPFFRPAYINLVRNLNQYRAEAHALALADMAIGS